MVNEEIDFIVANFKSLLGIGHEASLKLECKLGEVWMNLSCKVGRNEPPLTVPAPNVMSMSAERIIVALHIFAAKRDVDQHVNLKLLLKIMSHCIRP